MTGKQAQVCAIFWYRTVIHWSGDEARLRMGFEMIPDSFCVTCSADFTPHQHAPNNKRDCDV
jgi:hypothetical protein